MAALAALIYLTINLYRIINLTYMSAFNYIFLPTINYPSFYYISIPSNQVLEPPAVQTQLQIPSQTDALLPPPSSHRLELSEADLLAAGYQRKKRIWSVEEDQKLLQLINNQNISWKQIDKFMPQRTEKMCYSRYRRLIAQARHRWSPEDEKKLKYLVQQRGELWKQFARQFPNRTWKQLRDKYVNYLRPDINKQEWSLEEDKKILQLMSIHGTRWKSIQQEMNNRTDNQIKNRFYGRLKILLKRKAKRRLRN